MKDGRDFLDLSIRGLHGGVFVASGSVIAGDRIQMLGQVIGEEGAIPVDLEVPLTPREEDREVPVISVDDFQLTLQSHDSIVVGPDTEVHTMGFGGDLGGFEATVVVDPIPLIPIFAAVALAAYVTERKAQAEERRRVLEQMRKEGHDCLERGGFPEWRIQGRTNFELRLEDLTLKLNPSVGYDYRCRMPNLPG